MVHRGELFCDSNLKETIGKGDMAHKNTNVMEERFKLQAFGLEAFSRLDFSKPFKHYSGVRTS